MKVAAFVFALVLAVTTPACARGVKLKALLPVAALVALGAVDCLQTAHRARWGVRERDPLAPWFVRGQLNRGVSTDCLIGWTVAGTVDYALAAHSPHPERFWIPTIIESGVLVEQAHS